MTKQEFNFWWGKTESSKHKWVRDEITGYNSKLRAERSGDPAEHTELFYTGGKSGIYIEINGLGKVTVGEYEGAFPHIGEAIYSPKHSGNPMFHGKPAQNMNEGFTAICERLGLQFLIDLFSGDF
jgi:hypothetical protein